MTNFILKDNNNDFLTLLICTTCNRRCTYCKLKKNIDKNTKYDEKFDHKNLNLLNKYDLNEFKRINIQGGEPGTLSDLDFNLLFGYFKNKKILNNKINIYTNGLFLEKYLENKNNYKNYIYQYHVIDFNSFKDYSNKNINLFHNYVVHNYECLEDFEKLLKTYPNINFEMVLDVNLNTKNISDEFFNKLKYLFETYKNVNIMSSIEGTENYEKELFTNKNSFFVVSSFLIKKQLSAYSNN